MSTDISTLEQRLTSPNKQVRLKAVKLLLRHPDATPIHLVKCLCSQDNRNFEFLKTFELDAAMREAWERLSGVTDSNVYEYVASLYAVEPDTNVYRVIHVLELLSTQRSLEMLNKLKESVPTTAHNSLERAINIVNQRLKSNDT